MPAPPRALRPLFLLDYDGTLAPFAPRPDEARPHPGAPALLAALDRRYPLWIVTGRMLEDLAPLLPLPLRALGMHGAQEGRLGEAPEPPPRPEATVRLLRAAQAGAPDLPGVRTEQKGAAFALHYRGAPDEAPIVRALEAWAAGLPPGLEALWGKKVLEVRPAGEDKGAAALRIAARFPGCTPVFIGDDASDEDAFRALGPPAVTVKVGPEPTSARFRLAGIPEVMAYLRAYLGRSRP